MDKFDELKLWVAAHCLQIDGKPAPWAATPNRGGAIKPEIIVLHETAGRLDAASSVSWLCNPKAKASAHLVVGRDGRVTQLAPFNYATWHAGRSNYRGRDGVNAFSIGIELVGPGKMRPGKPGHARAWFGEEYAIAEYGSRPVKTSDHGDGLWMPFTATQITMTIALCKVLADAYAIKDITAHWAISPRRKVDPNPLFPIYWCRKLALGDGAGPMGRAKPSEPASP